MFLVFFKVADLLAPDGWGTQQKVSKRADKMNKYSLWFDLNKQLLWEKMTVVWVTFISIKLKKHECNLICTEISWPDFGILLWIILVERNFWLESDMGLPSGGHGHMALFVPLHLHIKETLLFEPDSTPSEVSGCGHCYQSWDGHCSTWIDTVTRWVSASEIPFSFPC